MMMHAPAAAKCLGEEKTMCNLQKKSMNFQLLHNNKEFKMSCTILYYLTPYET